MSNIDLSQDKIINPYDDIEVAVLNEDNENLYGSQYLNDVRSLQVGYGGKVLRADSQGIWLGAEEFADAPFSVDMEGNVVASSLTLGSLSGDLDDIDDGSTYAKTTLNAALGAGYAYTGLNTSGEIIKGFLNSQLSSKTLPTNGVRVDANGIYGRNAGSTTFYIDSNGNAYFVGSITSSSMSASTITGSTITGTTLTTATSGQRVVLTSTLASYYNSSGTKIVETYASSNSFLIRGYRSTSAIWIDAGSSSSVGIGSGGDIAVYIDNGTYAGIYPYDGATSSSGYYCGNQVNNWYQMWTRQLYVDDRISLNGSTIYDWSDITPTIDPTDIGNILSSDLGGMDGTTLRVRRVTSAGVDSGWYQLTFDYGLLTSATVN